MTDNYSRAEVLNHIELLWEAGRIEVYLPEVHDDIQRAEKEIAASISVGGLRHEGQDFVGNIREESTWKQTEKKAESIALDVPKDTITA